jgi:hypothetical protein
MSNLEHNESVPLPPREARVNRARAQGKGDPGPPKAQPAGTLASTRSHRNIPEVAYYKDKAPVRVDRQKQLKQVPIPRLPGQDGK